MKTLPFDILNKIFKEAGADRKTVRMICKALYNMPNEWSFPEVNPTDTPRPLWFYDPSFAMPQVWIPYNNVQITYTLENFESLSIYTP
jgi:hypothetical protein